MACRTILGWACVAVGFGARLHSVPRHSVRSYDWGLERIGAPKRNYTGIGLHVYVLDMGIRVSHTEFGGRAIPFAEFREDYETIRQCAPTNTSCGGDNGGHGTHCAGIIAGTTYGVAPDATVYAVKIIDEAGLGALGAAVAAMRSIAVNGNSPGVVSMSVSYGDHEEQHKLDGAIEALVNTGITVTVAAGNQNEDACQHTPASSPNAITVGATSKEDGKAWFSNYGTCVDIWAPGVAIRSAWMTNDTATKTCPGTSMACPYVAGAAALLLQENPSLTPQQVRESLIATSLLNVISGLTQSDANKLLFIGGSAPTPTPHNFGAL